MIRVATFNVNSIRTRQDIVMEWLRKWEPDFLALQETKVIDDLFPLEVFTDAQYHVIFRGQKSYNGVALLSRHPAKTFSFGFDDGGSSDDTRLLRADFKGLSIVNTYVPQGRDIEHPMYAYKNEWLKRLRTYFDHHFTTRKKLLWVGDMNVAHDPIDVHNPAERTKHVCYHQAARDAFAHCRDWGFIDTFRLHHPEGGHYTFYDYRNPRNLEERKGWRIDYILASPALARKCTTSWIDLQPRRESRPSDHVPLIAEFDL